MKSHRLTIALVTAGLLASVAVVAGVRSSIGVDGVVGFAAVLAVLAIAASEYGLSGRRLFSK